MTLLGFDPMVQVIHERDVVEAIALALRPGVRGIFNVRGPGELPLSRMLRLLGKRPIAMPGPLSKGLLGGLWRSRAASFPSPELDHIRYVCMVDDTRARRSSGFAPRYGIEETLRARATAASARESVLRRRCWRGCADVRLDTAAARQARPRDSAREPSP